MSKSGISFFTNIDEKFLKHLHRISGATLVDRIEQLDKHSSIAGKIDKIYKRNITCVDPDNDQPFESQYLICEKNESKVLTILISKFNIFNSRNQTHSKHKGTKTEGRINISVYLWNGEFN